MKHLAEKKRLLYVALTRAEHDVVISANLKQKKDGDITLREDSYLTMIMDALGIEVEDLYEQEYAECIEVDLDHEFEVIKEPVEYIDHTLEPLHFASKGSVSATANADTATANEVDVDVEAAKRGTIVHKIIELYWETFFENKDAILDKMGVMDESHQESIINSMQKFHESTVCSLLQNSVEHHFELEFNHEGKTGFIDFIYFDPEKNGWVIVDFKTGIESEEKNRKYQEQLTFYKEVMESLEYKIVDTQLLWL